MIAAKIASSGALEKVANEWRMPMELAGDLVSDPDHTTINTSRITLSSYLPT